MPWDVLTYTPRHAVDASTSDPPYNTGERTGGNKTTTSRPTTTTATPSGSRSWSDAEDRHASCLNPDDSVLIVTIDEKEYLRLGLLEQVFPDATSRW